MSRFIILLQYRKVIASALLLCVLIVTFCTSGCHKEDEVISPDQNRCPIFMGNLAKGFDMGVNTSGGLTNWVTVDTSVIEMSYPAGQTWGAVFITVGEPTIPPRPGRDLSRFSELVLELCGGQGNETVWIGVKDNTDPDDGSEARVKIYGIGTDWEEHVLPLSQFYTAKFESIYVPIEFVFDGGVKTVRARNIEYRH